MNINGIEITSETILATRNHFVGIYKGCIAEAVSGEVRVNDLDKYIQSHEQHISKILAGESDHTLAFLQCALWLQTGECVAMLP